MKGQGEIQEKQQNEVEIAKTQKKKIRMMIVKMIQDLRNRIEKMQEMFTKDLEELKNKQSEMNNTLEGISSRITKAEEPISDLEDRNHCGNHCHKMEHIKKKKKRTEVKAA